MKQTESRNYEAVGRIFFIEKKQQRLTLKVNFDQGMITLFKEVRNLLWLQFRVPFQVQLTSSRAQQVWATLSAVVVVEAAVADCSDAQVYPFAVSLMESNRTYNRSCEKLHEDIVPLVATFQVAVQEAIGEGFQLHWESHKLDDYVKSLAEVVLNFQDRVDDLLVKYEDVNSAIETLRTVELKEEVLVETLARIQNTIDALNFASYSNLSNWVADLNARVEEILVVRLGEAVKIWIEEFCGENAALLAGTGVTGKTPKKKKKNLRRSRSQAKLSATQRDARRASMIVDGKNCMEPLVHEIGIKNQLMFLNPPIEQARTDWVEQFNVWLGMSLRASCGMGNVVYSPPRVCLRRHCLQSARYR